MKFTDCSCSELAESAKYEVNNSVEMNMDTNTHKESNHTSLMTGDNLGHASKDAGLFESVERRSPSPGVARRVDAASNNVLACDPTIDDLSNKLVDSLLDSKSGHGTAVQVPAKYVSMNEQIEGKQKAGFDLETAAAETVPSEHDGNPKDSTSHPVNDTAGDDRPTLPDHMINGSNGLADTLNPIDSTTMNIDKPKFVQNSTTRTVTNWETSNGMEFVNVDHHTSQEVDILTALSGEPTPNSLPQVTDGLSDGEVSSEESEEEDVIQYDLSTSNRVNHLPLLVRTDTVGTGTVGAHGCVGWGGGGIV